jgi:hypothetical protein
VLLRRHGPVATASPAARVAGATGLAGVAGGLEEAVLVGPMA